MFTQKPNKKNIEHHSYDLHIHFTHPDIPSYRIQGITFPITQTTINDIYHHLQNLLEKDLNKSFIFLDDTLPSPSTNISMTTLELEDLIMKQDNYYITTIPITILDPDKPPFYIAIPNNTFDLAIDITRLIQTYINQLYNKNIFTINNILPSPITADILTPQDLRDLVYYHKPLLITFITTPSEERELTLQHSSLDTLRNDLQRIQLKINRYNDPNDSINDPVNIYTPEDIADQIYLEREQRQMDLLRDEVLYEQEIEKREEEDRQKREKEERRKREV